MRLTSLTLLALFIGFFPSLKAQETPLLKLIKCEMNFDWSTGKKEKRRCENSKKRCTYWENIHRGNFNVSRTSPDILFVGGVDQTYTFNSPGLFSFAIDFTFENNQLDILLYSRPSSSRWINQFEDFRKILEFSNEALVTEVPLDLVVSYYKPAGKKLRRHILDRLNLNCSILH